MMYEIQALVTKVLNRLQYLQEPSMLATKVLNRLQYLQEPSMDCIQNEPSL